MTNEVKTKTPTEAKRFEIIWAARLDAGETISTSTWVLPTGITDSGATITGGNITSAILSGGTAGVRYTVTNRVVTSAGNTLESAFVVSVEDN